MKVNYIVISQENATKENKIIACEKISSVQDKIIYVKNAIEIKSVSISMAYLNDLLSNIEEYCDIKIIEEYCCINPIIISYDLIHLKNVPTQLF